MNTSTRLSESQKGNVILIVFLIAAIVGGYLIYTNYSNNRIKTESQNQIITSPTSQPTLSPSPKPADQTQKGTTSFSCKNVNLNPQPELTFDAYYCNGSLCIYAKNKEECESKDVVRTDDKGLLAGEDGQIDCKWDDSQKVCVPNK